MSDHRYINTVKNNIKSLKREGRHMDNPVASAEAKENLRIGQQRYHYDDLSISVNSMYISDLI